MEKYGWSVNLMSVGQGIIHYYRHYRLLNILFGDSNNKTDKILIDKNECEQLVSSINYSPVKKAENKIELDKSSEAKLDYPDQVYYSTQISSAFMYLLWGEYNNILPDSEHGNIAALGGTFTS